MLQLNTIKAQPGSVRDNKRRGRGAGSGLGGTAGKGHKGQKARSGGVVRFGFEGGQTPLYRRLPKVGFTNIHRRETAILNLSQLELLDAKSLPEISLQTLIEQKLIKKTSERLAILGMGEITKSFTIKAHRVSESAQEKIKKAGGTIEIVKPPRLIKKKKK